MTGASVRVVPGRDDVVLSREVISLPPDVAAGVSALAPRKTRRGTCHLQSAANLAQAWVQAGHNLGTWTGINWPEPDNAGVS